MDLDFFFPERVTLERPDGSSQAGLRAQIDGSNEKILLFGDQTLLSDDDVIVHMVSNGAVQRYEVLDVHYQRGDANLPAITTLRVRREGSKAAYNPSNQHVYNVSGNNARINVNSTDHSLNIAAVSVDPVFDKIRGALEAMPDGTPDKVGLLRSLSELSKEQPKTAGFVEKFQKFTTLGANCMTILGPFLPELAKLLR